MKKYLYFGLAVLLSLSACTRKEEMDTPDPNMTLIARTESSAETKTVVSDETHVYWEWGDEIAVFSGTQKGCFYTSISEPSDTAPFYGYLDDGSTGAGMDLWALYPYSWAASFENESITTVLPARQVAREGSFGKGMNLAVAHSATGSTLQFYNVGGGVRFSVQEDGIREVVFQGLDGEWLSGKIRIGFRDGLPAVLDVEKGRQSLSLFAPNGGTFQKDTWYYFVAIPGALEKGFEMHYFKEDAHGFRVFEKSVTVKRSTYGTITHADEGVAYSAFSDGVISFKDSQVKTILADHFDTSDDEMISLKEAVVVHSFLVNKAKTRAEEGKESIFAGTDITTFDEMACFTGLTRIDDGTFAECTELTSVTIPETVTSIGDNAFNGCTGLQTITVLSPAPPAIGTDAFANSGDCPISVPEDVVDQYVSAWDEYAYRIRAAEEPACPVPEVIDLGLPSGTRWASFNLGASKPEEYGNLYSWGETVSKAVFSESTYKWFKRDGNSVGMTKYCLTSNFGYNGFVDGKYILDPEDDAAHVKLGDDWRMPTAGDWDELARLCTREWVTLGDVTCAKLTGPNGNSIILPPGGVAGEDSDLDGDGITGIFWASSLAQDSRYAWAFGFINDEDEEDEVDFPYPDRCLVVTPIGGRPFGASIRPVYGAAPVLPESISLDQTELDIKPGETVTLNASVLPQNTTQKTPFWISEDEDIATVSSTGEVKGVGVGETIIHGVFFDGMIMAQCTVRVGIPEAVDLGLPSGIKWGSFNLGASYPYGDYYAWGETEPYYASGDAQSDSPHWKSIWNEKIFNDINYGDGGYCWNSYKFSDLGIDDDGRMYWSGVNKYTYRHYVYDDGYVYHDGDGLFALEPEDDAAHKVLGGEWRMPSWAEMQELRDQCTWEWTEQDGMSGQKVTGPNGNSIFLPATGYRSDLELKTFGTAGRYWTSSRYHVETQAMLLSFTSETGYVARSNRFAGYSIRPVQGNPAVPVERVAMDQTEIVLMIGETATLNATVYPGNATFTGLSWYYNYATSSDPIDLSSDKDQATVTAIAKGCATVLVLTQDGGKLATCKVTVLDPVEPLVDDLVGSYTCTTSSSDATENPWVIEIRKDSGDPHKVWFWNLFAYSGFAIDDTMFYGTVDETQGTITIPYGQETVYKYKGQTPITLYWIDANSDYDKTGSNTVAIRKDDSGKVVGLDFDERYGFGGVIEDLGWAGWALPRITAEKQGASGSASGAPRREVPSSGSPELYILRPM